MILVVALLAGGVSPAGGGGAGPIGVLPGWGESVGNGELDVWIAAAMAAAPSLEAAERAVRVEAAGGRAARAGRWPEATLEGDLRAGRNRTAMTGGEAGDVEPVAGRASAAWDLDIYGRVRAEVGAARFAELAADHRRRDRQLAFAADVAKAYVLGRMWNNRLQTRAQAVAAYDALTGYAAGRVKAGLALPAERERLEAARETARQQQVRAQQEISDLDARWRYLVPEQKAPSLRSLGGLTPDEPAPVPPDTAIHAYAVKRPDVRAAHALWQAAGEKARGAARERLPTVSAIVTAEGEGPSLVDEPESWTAWAGVRLSLPLLAPGRAAKARVEREQANLQEALFEETATLAIRDIRQAYARRVHAERAWRAAQVSADRLRERLESIKRQFEEGRVPVPHRERARLDWLAADETARIRYADVLLGQIDLVRACGGPADTGETSADPRR